jgi:hypothetical protein
LDHYSKSRRRDEAHDDNRAGVKEVLEIIARELASLPIAICILPSWKAEKLLQWLMELGPLADRADYLHFIVAAIYKI